MLTIGKVGLVALGLSLGIVSITSTAAVAAAPVSVERTVIAEVSGSIGTLAE